MVHIFVDSNCTTIPHGLAGIDKKIDKHLLQLFRIGRYIRQFSGANDLDVDVVQDFNRCVSNLRVLSTTEDGLTDCITSLGGRENSKKILDYRVDVANLSGNNIKNIIFGPHSRVNVRPSENNRILTDVKGLRILCAIPAARLPHHGHFFNLQEVLPTFGQFRLGLIHILE